MIRKPKIAVYPGSFDPITLGHLDIIERARHIFDKLIVAVGMNPEKEYLFSQEERLALVNETISNLDNVEATFFAGLLTDFVREKGAIAIVRGMRAVSDFEYEFQYGLVNRKLYPPAETVFFIPSEPFIYLNSTVAKTLAKNGASVSCLVPECVERALKRKFSHR